MSSHKWMLMISLGLSLVVAAQSVSAQTIIAQKHCATNFQGNPIRGMMQVERWDYYDTHRIYGQFQDGAGNLIELEVMTNQPGGVGGLWFNHARHRETHIDLRIVGDGFVLRTEDGAVAQFVCQ